MLGGVPVELEIAIPQYHRGRAGAGKVQRSERFIRRGLGLGLTGFPHTRPGPSGGPGLPPPGPFVLATRGIKLGVSHCNLSNLRLSDPARSNVTGQRTSLLTIPEAEVLTQT